MHPNWAQQARGTDLATLFLAAPVLAFGLWTARRGLSRPVVSRSSAGSLYLVYNYAIFAFAVAMNPLTIVHIAIFGLSLWSLLLAGRGAVAGSHDAVTERLNRRAAGGLLVGVAAISAFLWLGQIATATMTGVFPPDLVKAGISSNPVYALDLAFFLPLCALAGIGLLRRNERRGLRLPDAHLGRPHGRRRRWAASSLMAAAGDQIALPVVVAHQRPECRVRRSWPRSPSSDQARLPG